MPLSPEETANAPVSQGIPALPSAPPVGAQQCDTDHVEAGTYMMQLQEVYCEVLVYFNFSYSLPTPLMSPKDTKCKCKLS